MYACTKTYKTRRIHICIYTTGRQVGLRVFSGIKGNNSERQYIHTHVCKSGT